MFARIEEPTVGVCMAVVGVCMANASARARGRPDVATNRIGPSVAKRRVVSKTYMLIIICYYTERSWSIQGGKYETNTTVSLYMFTAYGTAQLVN